MSYSKIVFLTSANGSSYTLPTDWNDSDNKIEAVGNGGNGNSFGNNYNGGGGAYAVKVNGSLGTAGQSCSIQIGAGGGGADVYIKSHGGTTVVLAKSGANGTSSSSGAGGLASGCTPSSGAFSGGSGLNSGGAGGAAGPNGAGSTPTGNAGGNADGGTVLGGTNNHSGVNGTEWDSAHGCGSGAGHSTGIALGGGQYGGGGTGPSGAGGGGLIIIQYNPGVTPITGVSSTSALGSVAAVVTIALTGLASTLGIGNLSSSGSEALIGLSSASAVGSVTPKNTRAITGLSSTTGQGIVTPVGAVTTANLTGVFSTGQTGSPIPTFQIELSGDESVYHLGSMATTNGQLLSASPITCLVGVLTPPAPTDKEVNRWALNTIPVDGSPGVEPIFAVLTGVHATGSVGTMVGTGASAAPGGVPAALRNRYGITRPDIRRIK